MAQPSRLRSSPRRLSCFCCSDRARRITKKSAAHTPPLRNCTADLTRVEDARLAPEEACTNIVTHDRRDGFQPKPFKPDALLAAVHELLHGPSRRDQ